MTELGVLAKLEERRSYDVLLFDPNLHYAYAVCRFVVRSLTTQP